MKANFKKFPIYMSIRKDMVQEQDISYILSNAIYTNIPGIIAHSVAMRIYESDGEMELSDEETANLASWAEMFSGVIADSIKDFIKKNK